MKYAGFKYKRSGNFGDNVQTLAAEQYLPRVDLRIERDSMAVDMVPEPTLLIMNGWFSQSPKTVFPPHKNIRPVFFGFHISPGSISAMLSSDGIEYLKQHEPIGCRDRGTCELLESKGVNAFYSKCLTLTFPRRECDPEAGKVFIVDAQGIPVPRELAKDACYMSHLIPSGLPDHAKELMAQAALESYRDKARLVITTKIHCAMPCIAMGIPVIFFGDPNDRRLEILSDMGVRINRYKEPRGRVAQKIFRLIYRRIGKLWSGRVNWSPTVADITAEQEKMRAEIKQMIRDIEAKEIDAK